MTAQEIIEKIRAEVNRQRTYYNPNNPYGKRAIRVCNNVLSFLRKKEKDEKPMNSNEGLEEEFIRYIHEKDAEVSERSESTYAQEDLEDIARHFAQWGAEHRDSSEIPKDLESYAQRVEDYYDVGEERGYLCTHRGDIKNAVIAGAKWGAEHLKK